MSSGNEMKINIMPYTPSIVNRKQTIDAINIIILNISQFQLDYLLFTIYGILFI